MNATAPTILPDVVYSLLNQLEVRMVEGTLLLDKSVNLDPLSTSALRGVLGHTLKDTGRDKALELFKPSGSSTPPYVIQPHSPHCRKSQSFDFRIFAWDPDTHLLEAFQEAANSNAAGRPFGIGRGRVDSVEFSATEKLKFEGVGHDGGSIRLRLGTPLCLKTYDRSNPNKVRKRLLHSDQLTIQHLLEASLRRIANLTGHPVPIALNHREFLPEPRKTDLKMSGPDRRSTTQKGAIRLRGIVGYLDLPFLNPIHADILKTCISIPHWTPPSRRVWMDAS